MARDIHSLTWRDTLRQPESNAVEAITLRTDDGDIIARYHASASSQSTLMGAIWVGGSGGGLDGPARGLYPAACGLLQARGVAGLRLHYRFPNQLEDCVLDTLLGVEFLVQEGCKKVALAGHSFGGAVVIAAAANSRHVKAVVPMSTQTYGTNLAPEVAPRPMLLIHGTADEILPDACSRQVYARAGEPKELRLFPGARHGLDEAREEILQLLVSWIPQQLA
jgi:alpha-beta hydrolase superfamily lysophospholipase